MHLFSFGDIIGLVHMTHTLSHRYTQNYTYLHIVQLSAVNPFYLHRETDGVRVPSQTEIAK